MAGSWPRLAALLPAGLGVFTIDENKNNQRIQMKDNEVHLRFTVVGLVLNGLESHFHDSVPTSLLIVLLVSFC